MDDNACQFALKLAWQELDRMSSLVYDIPRKYGKGLWNEVEQMYTNSVNKFHRNLEKLGDDDCEGALNVARDIVQETLDISNFLSEYPVEISYSPCDNALDAAWKEYDRMSELMFEIEDKHGKKIWGDVQQELLKTQNIYFDELKEVKRRHNNDCEVDAYKVGMEIYNATRVIQDFLSEIFSRVTQRAFTDQAVAVRSNSANIREDLKQALKTAGLDGDLVDTFAATFRVNSDDPYQYGEDFLHEFTLFVLSKFKKKEIKFLLAFNTLARIPGSPIFGYDTRFSDEQKKDTDYVVDLVRSNEVVTKEEAIYRVPLNLYETWKAALHLLTPFEVQRFANTNNLDQYKRRPEESAWMFWQNAAESLQEKLDSVDFFRHVEPKIAQPLPTKRKFRKEPTRRAFPKTSLKRPRAVSAPELTTPLPQKKVSMQEPVGPSLADELAAAEAKAVHVVDDIQEGLDYVDFVEYIDIDDDDNDDEFFDAPDSPRTSPRPPRTPSPRRSSPNSYPPVPPSPYIWPRTPSPRPRTPSPRRSSPNPYPPVPPIPDIRPYVGQRAPSPRRSRSPSPKPYPVSRPLILYKQQDLDELSEDERLRLGRITAFLLRVERELKAKCANSWNLVWNQFNCPPKPVEKDYMEERAIIISQRGSQTIPTPTEKRISEALDKAIQIAEEAKKQAIKIIQREGERLDAIRLFVDARYIRQEDECRGAGFFMNLFRRCPPTPVNQIMAAEKKEVRAQRGRKEWLTTTEREMMAEALKNKQVDVADEKDLLRVIKEAEKDALSDEAEKAEQTVDEAMDEDETPLTEEDERVLATQKQAIYPANDLENLGDSRISGPRMARFRKPFQMDKKCPRGYNSSKYAYRVYDGIYKRCEGSRDTTRKCRSGKTCPKDDNQQRWKASGPYKNEFIYLKE